MTTETTTGTHSRTDLYVESWGDGTPVVLVHGSLATGAEEWQAQRPLADEGFRLLVPTAAATGGAPRPRARTSCATPTTSPHSWATARTSSAIPTAASASCSPPPAGPRRPYR